MGALGGGLGGAGVGLSTGGPFGAVIGGILGGVIGGTGGGVFTFMSQLSDYKEAVDEWCNDGSNAAHKDYIDLCY